MDLLSLLVSLLVLLVVGSLIYWAVHRIEAAFGMPGPIVAVVDVILVVILVIVLLGYLNGNVPLVRLGPMLR
jgi:hypothetical protein